MNNLTAGWPEALIIGLDSNYRGAPLEAGLAALGLGTVRISGVVLTAATPKDVDQVAAVLLQGRPLTLAEVGCAWAHRAAWRRVEDAGHWMFVFEDDARIDPNFLHESVGILLNSATPRVVLFDYYSDHTVVSSKVALAGFRKALAPPPGAWAYALNPAAARILRDNDLPIHSVSDWPVRSSSFVEFFVAAPSRARVAKDVKSSINDDRIAAESRAVHRRGRRAMSRIRALATTRAIQYYGSVRVIIWQAVAFPLIRRVARARGVRVDPLDPQSPFALVGRRQR